METESSNPLRQFRATLNMPEVFQKLAVGRETVLKSPSCTLRDFFGYHSSKEREVLGDVLPVINAFLDAVHVEYAKVYLSGRRNRSFYLNLTYDDTCNGCFEAKLSPVHNTNYSSTFGDYNEWQPELRALLRSLKL